MAEQSGQQIGLVAACKRLGVLWSSLSVSSPQPKPPVKSRQMEVLARQLLLGNDAEAKPKRPLLIPPDKTKLAKFESKLGTKIELNRAEGETGKLVIHFYSEEELQAIFDAILGKDEQL